MNRNYTGGFSTSHSPMTRWVWLTFGATVLASLLFNILGFFSWRSISPLASKGSAPQFQGCTTTPDDWHALLQGLVWAIALGLVGVLSFTVASCVLMVASFKSLSHPQRNFGRGWVAGAALFSCFLTITTVIHMRSFVHALDTWNELGVQPTVSLGVTNAAVVFGAIASILYFGLFVLLHTWTDTTVISDFRETPAGV